MTDLTYKLLEEARSLYSADGWIERNGEVIYSDDLVHELAAALEQALEGLAKAWGEGYSRGRDDEYSDLGVTDNPYRKEQS